MGGVKNDFDCGRSQWTTNRREIGFNCLTEAIDTTTWRSNPNAARCSNVPATPAEFNEFETRVITTMTG